MEPQISLLCIFVHKVQTSTAKSKGVSLLGKGFAWMCEGGKGYNGPWYRTIGFGLQNKLVQTWNLTSKIYLTFSSIFHFILKIFFFENHFILKIKEPFINTPINHSIRWRCVSKSVSFSFLSHYVFGCFEFFALSFEKCLF